MVIKKIQNILFLLLIASAHSIQSAANGFDEYALRPDVVCVFNRFSLVDYSDIIRCTIQNPYLSLEQVDAIKAYQAIKGSPDDIMLYHTPEEQAAITRHSEIAGQLCKLITEHISLNKAADYSKPFFVALVGTVSLHCYGSCKLFTKNFLPK